MKNNLNKVINRFITGLLTITVLVACGQDTNDISLNDDEKKQVAKPEASSVVTRKLAVSGSNAIAENGVPGQIDELKVVVTDLTKQVAELLPLKDDVKNIKEEISSLKTTVSAQQASIDSIKNNSQATKPDGQQIQERLSYEGANCSVLVTFSEQSSVNNALPDKVVYLWEVNNPNDKLVGITDYKGEIVFNVARGKQYVTQFKGDDKYKPVYIKVTSPNAQNDKWILATRTY